MRLATYFTEYVPLNKVPCTGDVNPKTYLKFTIVAQEFRIQESGFRMKKSELDILTTGFWLLTAVLQNNSFRLSI